MNKHIFLLHQMAGRDHRNIIGLMSGTSLDGLDIAYCRIDASGLHTKVSLLEFETVEYATAVKEKIREVFALPVINFPYLIMLNEWLGTLHGEMVNTFIKQKGLSITDIDAIASHGQTVMHAPKHRFLHPEFPNATLQIGDGDHIAVTTGIITISDFRQKHLAAGGEGAPLAVYGDYLMFGQSGIDRIMLNLGGIANFTYLPASGNTEKVFVTDTGPGNTLLDAYMRKHGNKPYDEGAELALTGRIHDKLLSALLDNYFFKLEFPKTTGPEEFNLDYVESSILKVNDPLLTIQDILATLNRLTAETIVKAIRSVAPANKCEVIMSGGGVHNPLLLSNLSDLLPEAGFFKSDALGLPADAKEAVLFAVLANETLAGSPLQFGSKSNIPGVCMGKISFPQ